MSLKTDLGAVTAYADAVKHQVSGKKIQVEIDLLAENLKKKADWLMEKIRRQLTSRRKTFP